MYEFFGTGLATTADLLSIVENTRYVDGTNTFEIGSDLRNDLFRERDKITVRAFCDRLGQGYAERSGKRYWADKTPDYGFFIDTLQLLWPDCRVLHVIRNGTSVAKSMSRHPGYQSLVRNGEINWTSLSYRFDPRTDRSDAPKPPMEAFAQLWFLRLMRTRDAASRLRSGSYLEVRYEALAKDPEAVLRSIAGFLDIEPTESWLRTSAAMVRPGRAVNMAEVLPAFGGQEQALLRELGYL